MPDDDVERGLALDLPPDLPAAIWGAAVQRLSEAPFLEPVYAEDLPDEVQPPPEPATLEPRNGRGLLRLPTRTTWLRPGAGSRAFGIDPRGAGRRGRPSSAATLLYAEASQYIGNEGSGPSLDQLGERRHRQDVLAICNPDTSRPLTFTSRSGTIPLRMGDPGDRVVNVKVVLASGRVEFLDDNERTVRLDQAEPGDHLPGRGEGRRAKQDRRLRGLAERGGGPLAEQAGGEIHRGQSRSR